MIFKVFYQERKDRSPRRETTKTLYVAVDTQNVSEGRIAVREMLSKKTNYNVEYIVDVSEKELDYEKEKGDFELTSF